MNSNNRTKIVKLPVNLVEIGSLSMRSSFPELFREDITPQPLNIILLIFLFVILFYRNMYLENNHTNAVENINISGSFNKFVINIIQKIM